MATFLILPPRELLEHAVSAFVARLLPGFPPPAGLWERVVQDVTAGRDADEADPLFVLHREDLTDDGVLDSLVSGFGAESGDEVIEVDLPRAGGPGRSRTWQVPAVPVFAGAR